MKSNYKSPWKDFIGKKTKHEDGQAPALLLPGCGKCSYATEETLKKICCLNSRGMISFGCGGIY